MLIILLILIFIRPFISSLAFPYLNAVYSALLLILLIFWVIYKGIPLKKIQLIKYPLILFCSALIISIIFSTDRLNSLKEIYKYVTGLLLFMLAASLADEDKRGVIHAIVLSAVIISFLAIYQYFFGFQHLLNCVSKQGITDSFTLDYITRKRVFFPFVTPNILGGYLAMIIPLTFIYKHRIGLILPISFALLLSKSLGALLSLFLTLVVYFYLQGGLKKRKIIFLSGILAIFVLIFIMRLVSQKEHLQPIFSTVMRLNYWRDTLQLIKLHPFVGVGPGNFNLTQSRYAHNSYLQLCAEAGILGISFLFWLIYKLLKIGLTKIKKLPKDNIFISLLVANMVFLLHNLVDFSFFLPEVAIIWWILLGLILNE